ncbi:hypothetical protein CALCODRAFT_489410 [Calocera cornea HHB12733]|uniref:PIN domain-containing protein n=1 Tax=Calocera cornea HHB12733 TaxID=1353952 RepID=A0A165KA89_9BASI|nr:hypothetical protein CALCODRAFT_489410 [Calocera cornea HHB12733]
MPTFADQWNAHPPADIVLSRYAKVITISGPTDDVREVDDAAEQSDEDYEMEDVAALTVVNDVRDVRAGWQQYKSDDQQQYGQWGDAMEIDYESSSGAGATKMVVDTNILLSYLDRLRDMYDILCASESTAMLELVIPGIVLQELDFQTKSARARKPELQNLAQTATHWLLTQVLQRRAGEPSIVRVQRDHETYVGDLSWKTSRASNDDLILDCCQYFSRAPPSIYLLTNDVNLSVKAEAHDIYTLDRHHLRDPRKFIADFVSHGMDLPLANDRAPPGRAFSGNNDGAHDGAHAYGRPAHHHSHHSRSNHDTQRQHDLPNDIAAHTPPQTPESTRKSSLRTKQQASASILSEPLPGSSHTDMDVDIADMNGPRRTLEALHALFLEYLATYLPAEVASFLTLPRGKKPSSDVLPAGWQSWSPQKCFKMLQQATPLKPPSRPLEWTCVLAFTARPGESGYRANGGSVGDWRKASFMLHLVNEAYSIECLNLQALNNLVQTMESIIGLPVAK